MFTLAIQKYHYLWYITAETKKNMLQQNAVHDRQFCLHNSVGTIVFSVCEICL